VVADLARSGASLHDTLEGRVGAGHLAARGGHVTVLQALAQCGYDLRVDTVLRNTVLHEAAKGGHARAVSFLLAAGVDPGRWAWPVVAVVAVSNLNPNDPKGNRLCRA
jgi:hypothetical protein